MADIVGTAYVRVKVLSNKLGGDVEDAVTKGMKDVDVTPAGEKVGDDIVKGTSKTIEKDAGKSVKDSLEKAMSKGDFKKASSILARKVSDDFNSSFDLNFSKAIERGDFEGAGRLIKKKLSLEKSADDSATGFVARFKKKIESLFQNDDTGEKVGKKFGEKFGKGLFGKIAIFGTLFSPAVLGAGSLLVQYVTALVSQLGLLAVAAVGAGAAMGVLFGGVALSIIPLFLAFKATTDEMDTFKKTLSDVGEQFLEIGAATQETLLPGLTKALKASTAIIPVMRGFGREVGKTAGYLAQLAVGEFTGDLGRLRTILQGASRIFNSFAGFAVNFVSIFLNLFRAALPIGERFAESLRTMSDRWKFMIGATSADGSLAATLSDWYDKAVLVGGALGDLFVALWNVLTVGADSAVPFFDNFATWAQGFRDFTSSVAGQNKLKQIFDDANAVAHEFNGLIVDIFNIIGGQVFEAGGNDGIIGFIRTLREDFIPLLDGFADKMASEYGPALSAAFDAFSELFKEFAQAKGLNITLETLTITLQAFTEALELMLSIPGFAEFLGVLFGVAGALSIIGFALKPFKLLIGPMKFLFGTILIPAFTALAELMPVVGTGFLSVLTPFALAAAAIAAVVGVVALLVIHWDKVKAAFEATVRFFKDPMARLEALRETIENLLGTLRELGGKLLGIVGRAFARLGSIIAGAAGDAFDAFIELIASLPERAIDALSDLGGAFLSLGDIALDALANVGETIITGLIDGLRALPGALLRALNTAFHFAFEALRATIHRLIQGVLISFIGLPLVIVQVLARLGPLLIQAFTAAISFLIRNLGPLLASILNFFQDLPGNIIEQLDNLGGMIADFFTNTAWPFVTSAVATAIDATIQFFRDLPGNAVDALIGLGGLVADTFQTALDAIRTVVDNGIDAIIQFFRDLPGNIVNAVTTLAGTIRGIGETIIGALLEGLGAAPGAIVDLAEDMFDAVRGLGRDLINGVIHALNDLLPDKIGEVKAFGVTILPGINLPNDPIPDIGAMGGIFKRATNMIIGEAGPEVLIPLTNPRRALELFNKSGLANVLASAQRGRSNYAGLSATMNAQRFPVSVTTKVDRQTGGNVIIQQMNVEAPTPLEAARQTAARLRIMQSQLVSR